MDKHHFTDEHDRLRASDPSAFDASTLELLGALRPDGNDFDQAEMAVLRTALLDNAKLQRAVDCTAEFDRDIRAAMHDVDVPADLDQRLLDRLAPLELCKTTSGENSVVCPASATATEAGSIGIARPRRLMWGVGIAASVLIAAFATWQSLKPSHWSTEQVPRLAQDWQSQLADNWTANALPSGFTVPYSLKGFVRDWQKLSIEGRDAIAIRLVRGQLSATLFIVDQQVSKLPKSIPLKPQSLTGGSTVGFWRGQDGKLNVLLVQGSAGDYKVFAAPESGALASQAPRVAGRLAA